MKTNVLTLIITLVVGVILAGALLMPVINDATKTDETFTNVGNYVEDAAETYVITWDGTDLKVNDSVVTLPESGQTPIVSLDGFAILYKNNANIVTTALGYTVCTSVEFTAEEGTLSGSYVAGGNTNTVNVSYTDIQVLVSEKTTSTYSNAPKVKEGDAISMNGVYTFNDSAGSSHPLRWSFTGTVGGDCEVVTISGVASQYEFSNAKINYVAVDGFEGLYTIESISFDVAYTHPTTPGVTANFTITNTNMIGPAETTAELTDHLTTGQIALISAIPIMVIVALLLGAVSFVTRRE